MKQNTSKPSKFPVFETIVFVSGCITMVVELIASRVLAPYFGTSVVIWTSIIAVLLGALSIGYWLGGILSAKMKPTQLNLVVAGAFAVAGITLVFTNTFRDAFLPILALAIPDISIGSIVATTLLFIVPVLALGMISPVCVSWGIFERTDKESATFIGRMYAIGTIGSILGTFLGGYFLISFMSTSTILYVCSILLLLMSLLVGGKSVLKNVGLLTLLGIFIVIVYPKQNGAIFDTDTQYGRVIVEERRLDGREVRIMRINSEFSSAIPLSGSAAVFDYVRTVSLIPGLQPTAKRVLILGGGAYTMPEIINNIGTYEAIDTVEIDPKLEEIAQKYFFFNKKSNMSVFPEDGRLFLKKAAKFESKYDFVYVDVYKSLFTVPHHMVTKEMVADLAQSTTDNGIAMVNIIASDTKIGQEYFGSIVKTYQTKFPYIRVVPLGQPGRTGNIVFIAAKQPIQLPKESLNPDMSFSLSKIQEFTVPSESIVFTDEFVPVEKYAAALFAQQSGE